MRPFIRYLLMRRLPGAPATATVSLIEMLDEYYRAQKRVYVSGNLLIFYERGNRRKHVSPDVFMVKGVEKGVVIESVPPGDRATIGDLFATWQLCLASGDILGVLGLFTDDGIRRRSQ